MKRILILTAILLYLLVALAYAAGVYVCYRKVSRDTASDCLQCGQVRPVPAPAKDFYDMASRPPLCPNREDGYFMFLTYDEAMNWKEINCNCP